MMMYDVTSITILTRLQLVLQLLGKNLNHDSCDREGRKATVGSDERRRR